MNQINESESKFVAKQRRAVRYLPFVVGFNIAIGIFFYLANSYELKTLVRFFEDFPNLHSQLKEFTDTLVGIAYTPALWFFAIAIGSLIGSYLTTRKWLRLFEKISSQGK